MLESPRVNSRGYFLDIEDSRLTHTNVLSFLGISPRHKETTSRQTIAVYLQRADNPGSSIDYMLFHFSSFVLLATTKVYFAKLFLMSIRLRQRFRNARNLAPLLDLIVRILQAHRRADLTF